MDFRPPTNSQPSNQLLCLATFRLQGLGDLGDLGLREVYMQVVVLITDWVVPIEGSESVPWSWIGHCCGWS
jgi:hypothetical protein